MAGFIDIHHHILYGMDDGPPTQRDTEKMLEAAAADETEVMIATPHGYPGKVAFAYGEFREKLQWANDYCQKRAFKLRIYPGCEIFYTDATIRLLDAGEIPTLAGSRFVLVEFEMDISYDSAFRAVRGLLNAGYAPVIAHIERYANLMRNPKHYMELRGLPNVRLQMNASTVIQSKSLLRGLGVRRILDEGLVDYVATDAHSTGVRRTCMKDCYRALRERYGVAYAEQLAGENQREIFAGQG